MKSLIIKKRAQDGNRIIISAKVTKRAVERNAIRRKIRAILQEAGARGYTVITSPNIKERTFEELKKEITSNL